MAGLFKNRIIKEKAGVFGISDLEKKLAIVKKWHGAYHDTTSSNALKSKTETQCEQAFNHDFFVEILGYKTFPNDVYTIEPKASTEATGQKPDAALGWFSSRKGRVIAVVEIKDAKTPLDRSQKREGNLSPIQQAFKYKPQFKDCEFVIATNFYETRLFKDNQLDYERFTLDELIDPKDGYFNFRKFYYLLCAENFIREEGKTETANLLSEIREEQEEITKEFYELYRMLRRELIRDIVRNNETAKKPKNFYSIAVEKAQKLIDRVVLVSFFEDSGLLPEKKLKEVVNYAAKGGVETPVWETMKRFFAAIDKGSSKLEIPDGYNGELFKPDPELDQLVISDEICRKFVELGKYNFTEDLSVNILGHIFEQSISDLESLRNFAEKKEGEAEKKDSRRKKEGIFYTPDYIVDYIVKNSLGKYLEEKEKEVFGKWRLKEHLLDDTYDKRLLPAYREYKEDLFKIKVLDPACGSGAFLVRVFDYLCDEHNRVAEAMEALGDTSGLFDMELKKKILECNIFGVDLNRESVEITKLSLWLKSARKGEKLTNLSRNIKCGNSLIDDPAVAGEKAFDWKREFEDIMDDGGFDVVVGNPPYVQLSKIEATTEVEKNYLLKKYNTSGGRLNTFIFFIHLAEELLKKNGSLSFIIPNTLLTQEYYADTRKLLVEKLCLEQIVTYPHMPFAGAVVENITFFAKKALLKHIGIFQQTPEEITQIGQINLAEIGKKENYLIDIRNDSVCRKIDALKLPLLNGIVNINQAIALKGDKSLSVKETFKDGYYKLIDGRNISRYALAWSGEYLEYELSRIHSCKTKDIFLQPKLFFRRVSADLVFTYDDENYFALNTLVVITPKTGKNVSLKSLLAVLNSKLINYYYINKYKSTKKVFSEIQARTIGLIPTPALDGRSLEERAETMLRMNKEFHEKLEKHLTILKSDLGIEKLPTKLEKFYELSFEDFVKAAKVKVLLSKKSELFDYFEKAKSELAGLKANIGATDSAIDQMVYKLYDLTPEEIKIVEQSTK